GVSCEEQEISVAAGSAESGVHRWDSGCVSCRWSDEAAEECDDLQCRRRRGDGRGCDAGGLVDEDGFAGASCRIAALGTESVGDEGLTMETVRGVVGLVAALFLRGDR